MKRWDIQTSDGYTLKLFYRTLDEAKERNPNCIITESNDYEYLEYVQKIKNKTIKTLSDYRGREILKIPIVDGNVFVRLYQEDDLYLDGLQFQVYNNNRVISPITWTCSSPKELYNSYLVNGEFEYKIYSFRKYGQPKLSKPKELKGIDKSFSVDYIPKMCKCQCFIKDNDLYIKHRDYFSESYEKPEDFGTPLEYRIKKYGIDSKKSSGFVYNDCWGDVVLRNEAWIVLENIVPQVKLQNELELKQNLIMKFCDCRHHRIDWRELDTTWILFWEKVVKELNKIYT